MHYMGRWDIVFYFFTVVLVIWWILFVSDLLSFLSRVIINSIFKASLCYEHPKNHPFISDAEKTYLQNQIENFDSNRKECKSTPWKEMLHSSPVLALVFSTVNQIHYAKRNK